MSINEFLGNPIRVLGNSLTGVVEFVFEDIELHRPSDMPPSQYDAFQHAYWQATWVMDLRDFYIDIGYPDELAVSEAKRLVTLMGYINEWGNTANTDSQQNMDLWNNALGRDIGATSNNRAEIVAHIQSDITAGNFILTLEDGRQHSYINDAIDLIDSHINGITGALNELSSEIKNKLQDFFFAAEFSAQTIDAVLYDSSLLESVLINFDTYLSLSPEWLKNNVFLTLGDSFLDAMETFEQAFQDPPRADPLVLDLDNDGFEFIDPRVSDVYFDYNGDGIGERTGWLAPDDGFLALDANNNGVVDGSRSCSAASRKPASTN